MNSPNGGADVSAGNKNENQKNQPDSFSHLRHEVRTPLNAIIGYSEMLLEDAADLGSASFTIRLQKIHATGRHLLALANDVLDAAKLAANRQDENLMALANEIRDRLAIPLSAVIDSSDWLARDLEAAGQTAAAADLRKVSVAGSRLNRFLREIARPDAAFSKKPAAGPEVAPAGSSFAAGSAEAARSPLAQAALSTPAAVPFAEEQPLARMGGPRGEHGSILVVDDNEMNRDILSRILMRRSYRVVTATDGREALAALEAHASQPVVQEAPNMGFDHPAEGAIDLVLLDILMPNVNGYETLERIHANPVLAGLPVVFISAFDDLAEKVKGFQAGAVDYITKPFQAEEVLARVENQLRIRRLQRELEEQNQVLLRKNAELVRAQKRTDMVFSALADALPGTVLDNKYRLEQKIGSGGFGAVFRATHLTLNRPIAVKVFRPMPGNDSPDGLKRFRLEGISASRVNHPNAVAVYDCGISESGIAYIVMELLEGHSLSEELRSGIALPLERVLEIALPVCRVLAEVHDQGMVHRDIKPDNIFLHRTRDGEIVKVVDFGLAKIFDEEAVRGARQPITRGIIGTPAYMAPERLISDQYDGRTDVYSLGVILYQMLTGQPPYHSDDSAPLALMIKHLTEEPPRLRDLNPAIPAEIETLVLQTLGKEPDVRPGARQLAAQLANWYQQVAREA